MEYFQQEIIAKAHTHLQIYVKEHMDYRNPSKVNGGWTVLGTMSQCLTVQSSCS